MILKDVLVQLCDSQEIAQKYVDLVGNLCRNQFMIKAYGFGDALMLPFDDDYDWYLFIYYNFVL